VVKVALTRGLPAGSLRSEVVQATQADQLDQRMLEPCILAAAPEESKVNLLSFVKAAVRRGSVLGFPATLLNDWSCFEMIYSLTEWNFRLDGPEERMKEIKSAKNTKLSKAHVLV